MKVVIKMTRGGHSEINAEPTDTIRVIKTKIKESPAPLGFAVDSQKIICEGKLLKDDKTLESYGFSENAKDRYLVLMVKQNNSVPPTISSNALSVPPTMSSNALSVPPTMSSNALSVPPTMSSNALSMPEPSTNTATIFSAEPGPSNSGILTPSSVQPSSQSSAVNHLQSASRTAQIVGVGSDGDQKVLATLEGSQIDDFEQLRAMGFSQQATVEAYLCCGKNVEHAATYLSENGNANSSGMSVTDESNTRPQMTRRAEMYGVDSDGDKKLLAILEGSQVDDIEALQALGFSQQATVEAYLLCDKEKERAASFLIENGNDSSSSNSESANNVAQLIGSLGGPDIDQIQQLEALGFPHAVALAAYLACNKNAQLAASVLVERGAELNIGSDDEPAFTISNTPLTLPSAGNPKASPTPVSETSGSSPTPSQKSLGKRPEHPWSPLSDDDRASKKTRTSGSSAAASSMSSPMPSSPPTSFLAEVSPKSEPMIIDDSEVEDNFSSEEKVTINKLEKMGFPREAVIEAICVCKGDEGCIIEYLCEKGYEV